MEPLQQIGIAAFVLAILVALLAFMRSKGYVSLLPTHKGGVRSLKTVERLGLTPQHSLFLIEFDSERLLVLTHPAGCQVVSEDFAKRTQKAAK